MPPYMYDRTNDSQFHIFAQGFKVSRYHFCWSDSGYMFARHQTWENSPWEVCNQWSSGVMRWWWTYKWLRTRLFIARVWEIWWRLKWHLQAKTLLSTYLLFTVTFRVRKRWEISCNNEKMLYLKSITVYQGGIWLTIWPNSFRSFFSSFWLK